METAANSHHAAPPQRQTFRLTGVTRPYDGRVMAIRDDLVDVELAGNHFAPHFARALPRLCGTSATSVFDKPNRNATTVTQLLHGEVFHVLDQRDAFVWGYCGHDHYVGYVPTSALVPMHDTAATHRVTASRAPVFATASIKAPVLESLPIGARIDAGNAEGDFVSAVGGFIHLRHLAVLTEHETDPVAVAQRYLGQPYLWGGRGAGGIDCSGLVQMAFAACDVSSPRDSDQQALALGTEIATDAPLQRGDLVFFPGHVGIMVDSANLIHANAYWMSVVIEPLADVVARLSPTVDQPVTMRRRVSLP